MGKPLEISKPHGRYQGDSLEGLSEVYVVEAVRIGMDGSKVGGGKPAFVDSHSLMRRRGAKPMRGACWMVLQLNRSSLLFLSNDVRQAGL